MEVILLEKVRNVGDLGEKVKIKSGFGRNFLIPQQKAIPATKANVERFEAQRAELERNAKEQLAKAEQRAAALEQLKIAIKARASDEGKLFGSITNYDVIEALTAQKAEVSRREVSMPNGPIRETGEHLIQLNLHTDVVVELTIEVLPE